MDRRLTVTVYTTIDDFRGLEHDWNRLLDRSDSRSIFLSWDWLYSWWCQFAPGRELRIFAARDASGELVGVAPLCLAIERRFFALRTLRFLGTERVSSDYLDLILLPERGEEAAEALWQRLLLDSGTWDLLCLTDFLESSMVLRHWGSRAVSGRLISDETHCQVCPHLPLPASIEELRRSLGSSTRLNFKRQPRRLRASGIVFAVAETADQLPAALERLYQLHHLRWKAKNQRGNFQDPRVVAFHAELTARLGPKGSARIYELRCGERSIASLYAYQFKGVLFAYQMGFDPAPPGVELSGTRYSPGFALIASGLEDAVRRGLHEFNFLRGPEAYKIQWTRSRRDTRTLAIASPRSAPARVHLRLERTVRAGKRVVKRVIRREASLAIG